ncbi:Hypothetical predicted protein, partial [Mytilus galloprovincialis]
RVSVCSLVMELFAVILVVGVLPDFIGGTCISKNDSVKEDFKTFDENQIADFDYAQFGKSKTIDCCAHNVSRILWYFWNKQYPEWRLFPWEPYCSICDNRPRLEDNNQTLLIMETGKEHSGIYRCIAMSQNNSIAEHNTTIEVFSCTERQTPLYIAPQDKYVSIGDTVTFYCAGDFGCTIDKFRQVGWYDENYDFINNSRYSTSYAEKYGETYVEVSLTITDTRESDFNKTFICLVSSPADYQYFEVHILKKPPACTERQTPLYIAPQDKYSSIGDTVTFFCAGDFGCTIDKFRQVGWYDENYDFINNSRYSTSYVEKYGETYVEVNLTITDTRESDFNKTFICNVSSTADYQYFEVHIFKKRTTVTIINTTTTKKMHLQPGVIVSMIASGIVIVIGLLLLLFRPGVMLFILSRIPCGTTDKGSKNFHALILHEDECEDRKLAEQLKTNLEEDAYDVIMSSDVKGGQDNLRALGDFSQKSASLIIIYPTKSCSEIFPIEISSAQPYFKPNRITVIIKRRGIENRVEALKYRYFKKITWPDKGVCTPFKETNFYSKLKLRMPRSSRNTRCCKCCKLNVSSTYSVHIQEQSYSTQSPMITTGIQLIKIP